MASIEVRERPNGTSYRVVWRQGKQKRSKTWATLDRAELWKGLIEQLDGDAAQAKQHLARTASQSPTVAAVADPGGQGTFGHGDSQHLRLVDLSAGTRGRPELEVRGSHEGRDAAGGGAQ